MSIVQRRCIASVESAIATERSPYTRPRRLSEIQAPHLRQALLAVARYFLETKAKEGERFYAPDDIHVYGPYPSRERLDIMAAEEEMAITSKDRPGLVREVDEEPGAFAHYLLIANFVKHDKVEKTLLVAR